MMNDLGLAKTQPTFDEFTAAVNNCTKIISPVRRKFFTLAFVFIVSMCLCLQCFDAVGWAAGRASGL